jgi:hypothetical protein
MRNWINLVTLTESFGNVIDFNPNGGDETLFRLDLAASNGTITDKEVKQFGRFLNDHKMDFIRMYHGTSARHEVMDKGLLATSATRARSLQSAAGFVYLAYDPQSALSFARMGYAGDYTSHLVVYAVDVTVGRLLPDHDQLRNKRQYGGHVDLGATLAHSMIYGRGARVRGRIEANQIHVWSF